MRTRAGNDAGGAAGRGRAHHKRGGSAGRWALATFTDAEIEALTGAGAIPGGSGRADWLIRVSRSWAGRCGKAGRP